MQSKFSCFFRTDKHLLLHFSKKKTHLLSELVSKFRVRDLVLMGEYLLQLQREGEVSCLCLMSASLISDYNWGRKERYNKGLVSTDPPDLRSISPPDCVYFCGVYVLVWGRESLLLPH